MSIAMAPGSGTEPETSQIAIDTLLIAIEIDLGSDNGECPLLYSSTTVKVICQAPRRSPAA